MNIKRARPPHGREGGTDPHSHQSSVVYDVDADGAFVVVCLCKLFVTQQDTALWLRDAFKRRAKPRTRRAHYEI